MNINSDNNVTSLFGFASKTIIKNIHSSDTTALEKLPLPKIIINQLKIPFLNQLIYKNLLQRSIKFNYKLIPEITQDNYESINLDAFFNKGLAQLTREFTYRSDIAKQYGTIVRTIFIKKLCEYIANININEEIKKIISIKILQNYNATKGLYADILIYALSISVSFSKTNITTQNQLIALENLLSIIEDKIPGKKFAMNILDVDFKNEISKNNPLKVTIQNYNEIFNKELLKN